MRAKLRGDIISGKILFVWISAPWAIISQDRWQQLDSTMAGAYDHLLRLIMGLAGLCRKLGVPFFFEAPRTSW
eukprot:8724867-Lingulodinium_polyedra.AAC.1